MDRILFGRYTFLNRYFAVSMVPRAPSRKKTAEIFLVPIKQLVPLYDLREEIKVQKIRGVKHSPRAAAACGCAGENRYEVMA